jgi:hypothetical protein
MPSHILVNNLALTYKTTIGISTATLPDVCKTPTPGGPVPMPYPNVANQGTLNKGTKTVKAKGKMIAIKGSQYSMSMGDEPGTVGGIKSNTFKQNTDWITYSFDVKMDGKNACRHTDKKFHNKKNTVDLSGNVDPADLANFERSLCKMLKDCTQQVDSTGSRPDPPTKAWCDSPGGPRPPPATGNYPSKSAQRGDEIDKCVKGKVDRGKARSDTEFAKAVRARDERVPADRIPVPDLGGTCCPDITVGTPPNCAAVYDIKTSCPPTPPMAPEPKWPIYGDGKYNRSLRCYTRRAEQESWHGKTQADVARRACGVEPKMIHPNSETCKGGG